MVNLFLSNGELDLFSGEEVDWTYTPIRFCDALTDPFTTDFKIPYNRHNTALLRASGLLDSGNRFGGEMAPANLVVNGISLQVFLQVANLTDKDITVAVYEKTIPNDVMNTTISDYIKDDANSVWWWDKDSDTNDPATFKRYMYGQFRNFNYAMYHPSKRMNDIINILSLASGYNLPNVNSTTDYWVTATNKNVCPQNQRQIVEVNFADSANGIVNGGQHITNDLVFSYSPNEVAITFNRQCNATMNIYVSYGRKNIYNTDEYFETVLRRSDNTPAQDHTTTMLASYNNGVVSDTYQAPNNYIQKETTLTFKVGNIAKFNYVSAVIDLTISDYDITADDYGVSLEYVPRKPKLLYRNFGENNENYMYFNGAPYSWISGQGQVSNFTPPYLSFCRIGFYCNLPQIKLKELLFGLCWLTQTKFQKRSWSYYFDAANDAYIIDGAITNIDTTNEVLGRRNHILFAGEAQNEDNTISQINNMWLEDNKNLHESPFAYSLRTFGTWAMFPQYSEREYDEEKGQYKCKFDELDGLAVSYIDPQTPNELLRVTLPDFGFSEVTQATTVEIETYNNVSNADYVYLHGRKYLVQSVDTDIVTGKSVIKAIEIWTTNPQAPINWPPKVKITDVSNVTRNGAAITFSVQTDNTIAQTQLKIYSDAECTALVGSYNGGTGQVQTIQISGLGAATEYWAVCEATDNIGVVGRSQPTPFVTHYAEPSLVLSHSNVSDTTAFVTFNYIGDYPIQTNIMTAEIQRTDGVGSPIALNIANIVAGVPLTLRVSNLAPYTEYVTVWQYDYYGVTISSRDRWSTLTPAPKIEIGDVKPISTTAVVVKIAAIVSNLPVTTTGVLVKRIPDGQTMTYSNSGEQYEIVCDNLTPQTVYEATPFVSNAEWSNVTGTPTKFETPAT